jgi:hypothetical protein
MLQSQVPPAHTAVAFANSQRWPQRPQLAASLLGLTQDPPQRSMGFGQTGTHMRSVASQVKSTGHRRAQPPQFAAVLSGVSQPVLAFESQSPNPGAQAMTAHEPARHAVVAFAAAQRTPH